MKQQMERGPVCLPGLVNHIVSEDPEVGVTPRAEVGPGRVWLLPLRAIRQPCPCSEGDTHSWALSPQRKHNLGPEISRGCKCTHRGLQSQPSRAPPLGFMASGLHPQCRAAAPDAGPDVREAYQRFQGPCKADKRERRPCRCWRLGRGQHCVPGSSISGSDLSPAQRLQFAPVVLWFAINFPASKLHMEINFLC